VAPSTSAAIRFDVAPCRADAIAGWSDSATLVTAGRTPLTSATVIVAGSSAERWYSSRLIVTFPAVPVIDRAMPWWNVTTCSRAAMFAGEVSACAVAA
jgi:hypothetical protein